MIILFSTSVHITEAEFDKAFIPLLSFHFSQLPVRNLFLETGSSPHQDHQAALPTNQLSLCSLSWSHHSPPTTQAQTNTAFSPPHSTSFQVTNALHSPQSLPVSAQLWLRALNPLQQPPFWSPNTQYTSFESYTPVM